MEQTDPGKAERVWSRVMCAQNIQTMPACPCKEDSSLSAETLAELIRAEMHDWCLYRSLACTNCRQINSTLLCIAEQEKCHAKKLSVLYFLATGKKYCPPKPNPACTACFNEAVRQAYKEELESACRYDSLAQNAGSHACTLRSIAEEEREHARQLACILQTTL